MNRDETVSILRGQGAELRGRGITRLALFGSVVRDQDRSDSDIDLLVDVDGRRALSLMDLADLHVYFEDLLGRPVDVVRRDRLKPFLRDAILAEAVEIYPNAGTFADSASNEAMSPRSPRQRLEDMREAIDADERFVEGRSLDEVRADRLPQLALERTVEIVSAASRHIPDAMKVRHPEIPWPRVRDIGNVLRHGYEVVDPAVIWAVVTRDFAPLKTAVEAMIAATESGSGGGA